MFPVLMYIGWDDMSLAHDTHCPLQDKDKDKEN